MEVGPSVHRCEPCRVERARASYFLGRGLPVALRKRRPPYIEPRRCRDCADRISHRAPDTVRCKACVANRKCLDCGRRRLAPGGECLSCHPRPRCSRRRPPVVEPCSLCGKGVPMQAVTRRLGMIVVCRRCASRERSRRLRPAHRIVPRLCQLCRLEFTPNPGERRRRFCSPKCCSRHASLISKQVRRAREAGAQWERIDPFAVFFADGWKCQHCGVDTPPGLRGSIEPNAPELDHIIPLSRGGAHVGANVQTLCRQCNSMKGNSVSAYAA